MGVALAMSERHGVSMAKILLDKVEAVFGTIGICGEC